MSNSPKPVTEALKVASPMKCGDYLVYPVKVAHAIAEEIACAKEFVRERGFTTKLVARFFVLTHPHETAIRAATNMTEADLKPFLDLDVSVIAEFVKCYETLTANAKKIASTMDGGKNPIKATGRA